MVDFGDMLKALMEGRAKAKVMEVTAPGPFGFSPPEPPARPDHEAQIMELLERAKPYIDYKNIQFRPGDIVTPRQGGHLRNPGEPHVVLEVRPDAEPLFGTDPDNSGNPNFGNRFNIRVLVLADSGSYLSYWCEAAQYEPYLPDDVQ